MTNEKNLVKGLIVSAVIIGGSILLTGAMGILSHAILGHKKPHPPKDNVCCERRIPSNNEHFKNDGKMPPQNGHMKGHENAPNFKGEKKEEKPENFDSKNDHPKAPENNPNPNA